VTPTRRDRILINDLYAEDFERLGYEPREPDAADSDGAGAPLRRRFWRAAGMTATRLLDF